MSRSSPTVLRRAVAPAVARAIAAFEPLEHRQLLTVSVTAFDGSAREPSNNGVFTITRTDNPTLALAVNVTLTGNATRGSDYELLVNAAVVTGNIITIPAGSSTVDVTVNVLNDNVPENLEIATLSVVAGTGYTVAAPTSANVTIVDDDNQTLITAISASAGNKGVANLGVNGGGYEISADGRYATYITNGTNIVNVPLTTYFQVYRRDLLTNSTQLVTINASGKAETNNDALFTRMDETGRYIAYMSLATNVLPGNVDGNTAADIYFRDMTTNQTIMVTRGSSGAAGGELVDISDDGQQVLFTSSAAAGTFVKGLVDTNNTDDLFLWNRRTNRIQCVSMNADNSATANRSSRGSDDVGNASFSHDGRFILFPSRASDMVKDVDDGNTFQYDLFVRSLATQTTEYVSRSSDVSISGDDKSGFGEITDDNRYVIFRSEASDLVFGDDNDKADIFVRDRQTNATKLLSKNVAGTGSANGDVGTPDITADGRFAVFTTTATNAIASDTSANADVYLVNVATGVQSLVSVNLNGNGGGSADSGKAIISDNGNLVSFTTNADNLPAEIDKTTTETRAIYLRNLQTGLNTLITDDALSSTDTGGLLFSDDGTRLVFYSDNGAIIAGDDNAGYDIFTLRTPGGEAAALLNGVLTVRGSPIADQLNVQRSGSQIIVLRNNERFEFVAADVTSIQVLGGDGNDSITLGVNLMGAYVSAGSGDDNVIGGGGNDTVQGGPGRDNISGNAGEDRIDGGKGNDTINGNDGKDRLYGSDGSDIMNGGGSVDRLFAGLGADTLFGGTGNDRFYTNGDSMADQIFGQGGTDTATRDLIDSIDTVENG